MCLPQKAWHLWGHGWRWKRTRYCEREEKAREGAWAMAPVQGWLTDWSEWLGWLVGTRTGVTGQGKRLGLCAESCAGGRRAFIWLSQGRLWSAVWCNPSGTYMSTHISVKGVSLREKKEEGKSQLQGSDELCLWRLWHFSCGARWCP